MEHKKQDRTGEAIDNAYVQGDDNSGLPHVEEIGTGAFFHDISTDRKHPHLSLFAHFSFTGFSWVLVSAVTKLAQSELWFLSYTLTNLQRVMRAEAFSKAKWGIYSEKKIQQRCGLTHNEPGSSILTFIPWPWMTLIKWPWHIFFFDPVWPRVHFLFWFSPLQISPY